MLPSNLKFEIKHVQQKHSVIAGTIHAHVKKEQVAIAKYLIKTYEGRMKILQLDVSEAWQKRGIGTLMATMMKAIAKGYELDRINLMVAVVPPSWGFWEKQGFKFYATNYMEFFPKALNKGFKID